MNTLTGIALAHLCLSLVYQPGDDPVSGTSESASILELAELDLAIQRTETALGVARATGSLYARGLAERVWG